MSLDNETFWSILDRYVAGECSAAEAAEVRDWLASMPEEHESLLADIRRIRSVIEQRPVLQSADVAWRKAKETLSGFAVSHENTAGPQGTVLETQAHATPVMHGARLSGIKQSGVRTPSMRFEPSQAHSRQSRLFKTRPLRGAMWYKVVGAALLLVIGWRIGSARHDVYGGRSASIFYTTGNGQRANITLPDGNSVTLNVASRLEVPADYLAGDHALRLNGAALFTIRHHAGTPFTVRAGQTTTQVLGTSFMVRRYPTDTVTTVAVREGKVAVDSTVVTDNQMVMVGRRGITAAVPAALSQFSFATGTLTIDELNLPEAIPELDRWFDADIRLGDPALATRDVGGKFAAGSLSDLSAILALTLDVRVVRDGRVLTLYPIR